MLQLYPRIRVVALSLLPASAAMLLLIVENRPAHGFIDIPGRRREIAASLLAALRRSSYPA